MKTIMKISAGTIACLVIMTSCVQLSVYKATERRVNALVKEREKLDAEVGKINSDIESLQGQLSEKEELVNAVNGKKKK
ncbi:MAG: hypothetical protein ACK5D5_11685 [Bacteroidota bacterium]|jgi:peptidoglycan hydrolase CwlO-like protein